MIAFPAVWLLLLFFSGVAFLFLFISFFFTDSERGRTWPY